MAPDLKMTTSSVSDYNLGKVRFRVYKIIIFSFYNAKFLSVKQLLLLRGGVKSAVFPTKVQNSIKLKYPSTSKYHFSAVLDNTHI